MTTRADIFESRSGMTIPGISTPATVRQIHRTAIVIMTLPGKPPSSELVRHANAISERSLK